MADGKYGSTTLHSHNSWGNRGGGGKKDRDIEAKWEDSLFLVVLLFGPHTCMYGTILSAIGLVSRHARRKKTKEEVL